TEGLYRGLDLRLNSVSEFGIPGRCHLYGSRDGCVGAHASAAATNPMACPSGTAKDPPPGAVVRKAHTNPVTGILTSSTIAPSMPTMCATTLPCSITVPGSQTGNRTPDSRAVSTPW